MNDSISVTDSTTSSTTTCSTVSTETETEGSTTSNTGGLVNLIGHRITSFDEAKINIDYNFRDYTVSGVFELGEDYLFVVTPQNMGDDDYVLGGYYRISTEDGSIHGYSPVANPQEFKEALDKKIQ